LVERGLRGVKYCYFSAVGVWPLALALFWNKVNFNKNINFKLVLTICLLANSQQPTANSQQPNP
tara:strand:+ start:307 stop:498 length:192 start_codon:yes stop_codon:yes gene_type:complete